jgi:hypothetical protein
LTGLEGGAATDLDSLNTVSGSLPVGICVFLVVDSIPRIFQLVEGTDVTNLPFVVRPADYVNQTGTKRVWKQRM